MFHTPLIEPDMQICRVAQPLLAFAPPDPTVRRYRSGLFRTDRGMGNAGGSRRLAGAAPCGGSAGAGAEGTRHTRERR
jgi:hypothetical protein